MVLEIIKYGHPTLREKGRKIDKITPEIRQLAAHMIETMYAANGVGLAAQQVNHPLLLTVIDVSQSDLPWSLTPAGKTALQLPLVLVNPVVSDPRGEQVGTEGCLSIPDINADIRRAEQVSVRAHDLDGADIKFSCTGLLARAVQHELDHLHGVLFVDRLDAATRVSLAGKLKRMQKETLAGLGKPARRRRLLVRF